MSSLLKKIKSAFFVPSPTTRKTEHPIKDAIRKVRYNLFGSIPKLGRKRSYGESYKARGRRQSEGFFEKYCQGFGLDIGYGGDPVVDNVQGWDFEHGDAHYLPGLEDEYSIELVIKKLSEQGA